MLLCVDYLSESNKSATIRRQINSLGTVLRLSKSHVPTKQPEVILALRRMLRKIGRDHYQTTPLTNPPLNQLLSNYDDSVRGLRDQLLMRPGYESMRHGSKTCDFKLTDIRNRRAARNRLSGFTSHTQTDKGPEEYCSSAKNCSIF